MYTNIFYDRRKSIIHLWEEIKGKRFYDQIHWVPYVFEKCEKSNIKSIYGHPVKKLNFNNYFQYKSYIKDTSNLEETDVLPEIQFLVERYHNIIDDDIIPPKLRIGYIDIEVHADIFPDPTLAEYPIVIISIFDNKTQKTYSFGNQPYTGKYKDIEYNYYDNERSLIYAAVKFIGEIGFDILTGWNVDGFDFPYIVNRAKNLGLSIHNLSSIGEVNSWIGKGGQFVLDVAGTTIIDYLPLYRTIAKRSRENLESYTLDYVSEYELGVGKLDYSEYKNLKNLYEQNWNLYVEYNVIDCKRVYQIDQKKGHIDLIQMLCLLSHVPLKYYDKMTGLIEGLMLTYFRRNNYCAPRKMEGGYKRDFPGAVVKEPLRGLYGWVVDLDIASSYPTAIITMNMSNETYYGKISKFKNEALNGIKLGARFSHSEPLEHSEFGGHEDKVVEFTTKREFPPFYLIKFPQESIDPIENHILFDGDKLKAFNAALKRGWFSITPYGVIYKTNKTSHVGVISHVEKTMFLKRKEVKTLMKHVKKEKGAKHEEAKRLYNLQVAIKDLINSIYGATSTPYSRYFNTHIAESITSCGRHTIRRGCDYVNELLNNPNEDLKNLLSNFGDIKPKNTQPIDYIIYVDTDSVDGNSIINTNNGDIKIEDLWKKSIEKNQLKDDVLIGYLPGIKTQTINTKTNKIEYKNISEITKHKVNKRIFRIKVRDSFVDMTEDHSLMVYRAGKIVEVKPTEILKTDKLIKIKKPLSI